MGTKFPVVVSSRWLCRVGKISSTRFRWLYRNISLSDIWGCDCYTLWTCFVIMYQIAYTMEGESLYGKSEDHPWRQPKDLSNYGTELSAKGAQLMQKFNQQSQHIIGWICWLNHWCSKIDARIFRFRMGRANEDIENFGPSKALSLKLSTGGACQPQN